MLRWRWCGQNRRAFRSLEVRPFIGIRSTPVHTAKKVLLVSQPTLMSFGLIIIHIYVIPFAQLFTGSLLAYGHNEHALPGVIMFIDVTTLTPTETTSEHIAQAFRKACGQNFDQGPFAHVRKFSVLINIVQDRVLDYRRSDMHRTS